MSWLVVRRGWPGSLLRALALAAAAWPACGDSGEPSTAPTTPSTSLRFENNGVLTVAPGQVLPVRIVSPDPAARISVWLEGDYQDASLGVGEIDASGGRAEVELRAPSTPTAFALRARAPGINDARLDVAVSAAGFGAIRTTTKYTGKRAAPEVVVSAFIRRTCDDLQRQAPNDGTPRTAGLPGDTIVLEAVPAATRLALSVRIGHYASGCLDVEALVPDAMRDAQVTIYDRPMALDRTSLGTTLTFDPVPASRAAWTTMIEDARPKALAAFIPGAKTEAAALLDAMREAVPAASTAAFDQARSAGSYETRTTTWLGAHLPKLRDRAQAFLVAGAPSAFGDLRFHVAGGASTGLATVTLITLGTLPAAEAGLSTRVAFGWTSDPSDLVALAGSVHLYPTALAARAADASAAAQVPGATTVASALSMSTQIDCSGLATSLVGAGASYPGCDATCTAVLCNTALTTLWNNARNASAAALEVAQIGLTASGQAQVGDLAEPASFDGAWVGEVTAPNRPAFPMKGLAHGAAAPPPPKP